MVTPSELTKTLKALKDNEELALCFSDSDFKNASEADIAGLASFVKTTQSRSSVKFLRMKLVGLMDKIKPLFEAIKENSTLHGLSFIFCHLEQLDDTALTAIEQCIKASHIKTVDLSYNSIGASSSAMKFLINLARLSNIQRLDCGGINLEDCVFEKQRELMQAFATSEHLTTLTLGNFHAKVGGKEEEEEKKEKEYVQLLLILFGGKIKNISLYGSMVGLQMDLSDFSEILNEINKTGQLRSLYLLDCKLNFIEMEDTESFINVFGNFLGSTALERINISNNNLSKETMTCLVKMASTNKALKEFVYKGNGLSLEEIQALEKSTQALRNTRQEQTSPLLPSKSVPSSTSTSGEISNKPRSPFSTR